MTEKQFDQFMALVKDCRATQREYFRHHNKNVMIKSMKLEKQVDEWIERYEQPGLPVGGEG